MTGRVILNTIRFIVVDLLLDVLFLPVWWYSLGLKKTIKNFAANVAQKEKELALFIWLQSMFKPMYGQQDWQGKIISFIFRIILLVWKSLLMFFWIFIYFLGIILWIILPPLIVQQILFNLINLNVG